MRRSDLEGCPLHTLLSDVPLSPLHCAEFVEQSFESDANITCYHLRISVSRLKL